MFHARQEGTANEHQFWSIIFVLRPMFSSRMKMLIIDARSYATAVANRARGGGCEFPQYYPQCEIEFMNLANIHAVRKSFLMLRSLCMSATGNTTPADQSK